MLCYSHFIFCLSYNDLDIFKIPNYAEKSLITTNEYIAPQDGFVVARMYHSSTISKKEMTYGVTLYINNQIVSNNTTQIIDSDSYLSIDSGLYPVAKNDEIRFIIYTDELIENYGWFFPIRN